MTTHDFTALRAELRLPPADQNDRFPADALAEAQFIARGQAVGVAPGAVGRTDLTDLPFVSIDPPDSLDLDQAVLIERDGDGFLVRYAIADLGATIPPGGPTDVEARRRGQTIYLPDGRVPLHPSVLSEGALSLLPDQVRGAAVWSIEVVADGTIGAATVERASVRSVARLDYAGVQRDLDAGSAHPSIEALADLGRLRRRVRLASGAIDLALPEQGVVWSGEEWVLRLEPRTDADAWNAEISLLAGMAAADLMLGARIGLLRTLPAPPPEDVEDFFAVARRLGVTVSADATPGEVLASLDAATPVAMALMTHATKLLRGAGYEAFDGHAPGQTDHAGIGGSYAHVTAPLRRLVDRFTTEVCLAISAGDPVPRWARDALPEIAEAMAASGRVASSADRDAIDAVETWMMAARRDQSFEAIVLRASEDDADIMISAPPVEARCLGSGLVEGSTVEVRVDEIDEARRSVVYRPG